MRKLILILIFLAFSINAYALEVKFTIDDAKVPRIVEAMAGLYQIPDDNGDGTPDFTPQAWAKEAIRRFVISTVQRYETQKARNAVVVPAENDLIN